MSYSPPDPKAFQRMIFAGVFSFLAGFLVVFALIVWLFAHFATPEDHWWEFLPASVNAIVISFVVGLCFALAATSLLSKIQYKRGVYRCPYCGKPLKGAGVPCDCPEFPSNIPMAEPDRKALFPGGLKPLYWALCVYVALIPLAYLVAIKAPGRKDWPLLPYAAVMHALLCAAVAASGKAVVSIVEQWTPNSRLRPYTGHIQNFIAVLAVWPTCIGVVMVVWKCKH